MLSSTFAQLRRDDYAPTTSAPEDPLEVLSTLLTQWPLPARDAQTARTLIERARLQYPSTSVSPSTSPPSFSQTTPLDPFWPLSKAFTYRSPTASTTQAHRTFARTHAPIAALPDDVMLHIFEYVRPAPDYGYEHEHGAPSTSLDWLVLTFVCRYWRHLALAHAPLWTSVPVRTPDLLFAFARRARDQPLELVFEAASAVAGKGRQEYLNVSGGIVGGLMGRVQLDMAATVRRMSAWPELGRRTRSLVFLDPSASAHWFKIAQCLPRELPHLESLRVEGADSGTGTVIKHILGEGAPALRVLSVTGCSFPPHLCAQCPNLQELRLVRNSNLDTLGPDEILGMLQALPRLGTFYLEARVPSPQSHGPPAALLQNQNQAQIPQQHQNQEDVGGDPSLGHRPQSEDATVRLPELRALTLVHAPRTVAYVLAHLEMPPAASVSLAFPASDGSVLAAHRADVFARVPALAKCTHASVMVHASKVSVHAGFGPRPADEERGGPAKAVARADPCFHVQYRRDYDFSQHFAGITALLPSLTSLSLAIDTGRHGHSIMTSISESGWRRLLGGLPHLTTLALGSNISFSHRALFRVLRSGDEHVADGKREWRWHLPKLRTLHFVDLVLREDLCFCGCMDANGEPGEGCSRVQPAAFYAHRDKWEYDDEFTDSAAMWIEGLRRVLDTRRQGHGVRSLRVRLSASSSRKWRASSCHHSEIARAMRGLAEALELVAPGE